MKGVYSPPDDRSQNFLSLEKEYLISVIYRLEGRVLRSCLNGQPSSLIHKTAYSRREIGMAKKSNNCGVLLKKNCGNVYIFTVGLYSYRKKRRVVGIAIKI